MGARFALWCMASDIPEGRKIFRACLESGQPAVIDLFNPDPVEEARSLTSWLQSPAGDRPPGITRFGLRMSIRQAAELRQEEAIENLGILILAGNRKVPGAKERLREFKRRGVTICWEFSPEGECPLDHGCLDAVVVRGHESGGFSRDRSIRSLFSQARRRFTRKPLFVQGAESPELAACFIFMGAAGLILDASLLHLPQASFSEPLLGRIQHPRENLLHKELLDDGWANVRYQGGPESEEKIPAGPNLFLCSRAAAPDPPQLLTSFRQAVDALVGRLCRTPSERLSELQADPFLVQGPMAGISHSVPFALACRSEGVLPVFSLLGLSREDLGRLGGKILEESGLTSYGLGITGKNEFDATDIRKVFATKPPSAFVLSADQWPFRQAWKGLPSPAWFHVQNMPTLETSLEEGLRHFIFEGGESGGHVGYLPGSVLWPLLFAGLREKELPTSDLRLSLAGGVFDGDSLLLGMILAEAFGFDGRLCFQLGTPFLFTREAIDAGIIPATYQKILCDHSRSVVLGPRSGAGLRVARTEEAEKIILGRGSGDSPPEAPVKEKVYTAYRRALEGREDGLFLSGESMAHFNGPTTLKDLSTGLRGYAKRWFDLRSALIFTDTMDFRVTGPLPNLDLAVVGVGGIFPGTGDVTGFWENIRGNQRQITEVPPEHWGPGSYRTEEGERALKEAYKSYSWFAGRIDDFTFDKFDCLKFRLPPRAAEVADRIHLMILKAVDQALESAGADFTLPTQNSVVLIGNSMGGEQAKLGVLRTHFSDIEAILEDTPEFAVLDADVRKKILRELSEKLSHKTMPVTEDSLVGGSSSTLGGRVAGYLDLKGINFSVDAACASSLAALGIAMKMFLSGDCSAAVIGGVDSDLTIGTYINFCKLKALAGHISRPFMADSDGFTMGEGAGVILIKPLEDAIGDGDPVFARIVGIGMSSDGRTGSMTMPSREGQELALGRAFSESRFPPETIGFIETHGTGTPVGDAVELEVLGGMFAGARPRSIALGAVKAHIGHLKSAAGIASLLKAVLALHHRTLPPAWIEGEVRPELRDPASPFFLPTRAVPWPKEGAVPRRAAVSSFGFGGNNIHVHLEQMDERLRHLARSRLLLFSGADRADLAARIASLDEQVSGGALDFNDMRQLRHMGGSGACRLAALWNPDIPWNRMVQSLQRGARGEASGEMLFSDEGKRKKIVFLFPGQGSATQGPFRHLRQTVGSFAHDMKRFGRVLGEDLDEALWPGDPLRFEDPQRVQDPALQPATTALSLSLCRLLGSLGIVPQAVAGHSLGFYTALAAAGVIDERRILHLVRERAACFEALERKDAGLMIALFTDEATTHTLLEKSPVAFYPANFNSPRQTVISIEKEKAEKIEAFLRTQGVEYQKLPVGWGFHSPLVAPAAKAFKAHLDSMSFHPPRCEVYSEITGETIPGESFEGRYPPWLPEHIIRPVRFGALVESLSRDGYDTYVEVGARGGLSRLLRETLPAGSFRSLVLDTSSPDVIDHWHRVLMSLYVESGVNIDLGSYVDIFSGHLKQIRVSGHRAPSRPAESLTSKDAKVASEKKIPEGKSIDDTAGREEVLHRLKAVIARHSGFEEEFIPDDEPLQETLGIDSLKMFEIVGDVEERFGISLAGATIPASPTLRDIAATIMERSMDPAPEETPEIGRYIVRESQVPLPKPGGRGSAPRIGLITSDRQLALLWEKLGRGPARHMESPTESELRELIGSLGLDRLDGVVYQVTAGRDEKEPGKLLARFFRPAFELALRVIPDILETRDAGASPFTFLTAGNGDAQGLGPSLSGFTRSLHWDFPRLRCGNVIFGDTVSKEQAAETLWREAVNFGDPFPCVLYRRGKRYVEHLEPREITANTTLNLTGQDVVLATGGGRGITAEILLELSRAIAPTWIITGSTDPESDGPGASQTRETLRKLRDLGCRAHYLRCDFSHLENVRRLAGEIAKVAPEVHGVIHGAGVLADGRIDRKTAEDFLRVVAVKAGSALVLQQILDLSKLRFWINFSSIVSFYGNIGQTDYAAANALLNQQARALSRELPLAKSILWGPWSTVGMAAEKTLQQSFASRGIATISPLDGVGFMKNELSDGTCPVVAYCGRPSHHPVVEDRPESPLWAQRRVHGVEVVMTSSPFDLKDPFLRDHHIKDTPVLPAVMALELSAAALPEVKPPLAWENLAIHSMITARDGSIQLVVKWTAVSEGAASFEGRERRRAQAWDFSGTLRWEAGAPRSIEEPARDNPLQECPASELYGEESLLFSGPLFQVLTRGITMNRSAVYAPISGHRSPVYGNSDLKAVVPVAPLDGLMQMAALYCYTHELGVFLPVGIDFLWWSGEQMQRDDLEAVVWPVTEERDGAVFFNGYIHDGNGERHIVFENLRLAKAAEEKPDAG